MAKTLPISSEPLNGVLHIQNKRELWSSWEFYVGDRKKYHEYGVNGNELNKLSGFPFTHEDLPEGIEVTLEYEGSQRPAAIPAAFHGYAEGAAWGGKHFYIGSRGKKGREFTELYRDFLRGFGVDVGADIAPVPVKLDFRAGNVVVVSRRQLTG